MHKKKDKSLTKHKIATLILFLLISEKLNVFKISRLNLLATFSASFTLSS